MTKNFFASAAFSSKDETWKTPRKVFDDLNQEFSFTLDAAAMSDSTLVEHNWFGLDHPDETRKDCLTIDWQKFYGGGSIFMNPPYGRKISYFMDKASSYPDLTVVCLVPSRTDTAWFHNFIFNKNAEIRFIRGRLKFNDGKMPAPFPSAIIIYRGKND